MLHAQWDRKPIKTVVEPYSGWHGTPSGWHGTPVQDLGSGFRFRVQFQGSVNLLTRSEMDFTNAIGNL